ncbi:hypothetical protein [Bacillus sp. 1P02SD]|uniref:hypothetical protein n=1 Tax=Bacillus sp. 1P02SD TaxID=3132264 RepID=UPI0039A37C09
MLEHPSVSRTLRTGYPEPVETGTRCSECGSRDIEEEWYPEENVRYKKNCDDCGFEVVEYED